MAKTQKSDPVLTDEVPLEVQRTRISFTWIAVATAVVFLVLLIIFIAQNNRQVPVHFLWISGHVSEAVALVVAALAGAVLVLLAGAARVIQLRVAGHRHNQQVRKNQAAAVVASAPTNPPPAGVPDAVETHQ